MLQFKQLIISLDREDDDDDDGGDKTKPPNASKSNNVYTPPADGTEYHVKNNIDPAVSGASSSGTPVANSVHPNQSANFVSPNASMNNSFTANHSQVSLRS